MAVPALHRSRRFRCLPLLLLWSTTATAFGPALHGYMATTTLADIERDCRVGIAGKRYPLGRDACFSIRNWPAYFLTGARSPELLPDPVSAQLMISPLYRDAWQSGDWLQHLVKNAEAGPALAFSMGYLLHAGHEVFANSWLNTLSGGEFGLAGDPVIAARHVVLEKYLDAHAPAGIKESTGVSVPTDFLAQSLIFDTAAVAQYRRADEKSPLVVMSDVRAAVDDLIFSVEAVEDIGNEMLAYFTTETFPAPLAQDVKEDSAALLLQHQALKVRLAQADADLLENEKYRDDALRARQTALAMASASAAIVDEEAGQLLALREMVAEQEKDLAAIPKVIAAENCRSVRKWINAKQWTMNRVCLPKSASNKAWVDAGSRLDLARKHVTESEQRLLAMTAVKASVEEKAEVAAKELASAEAQHSLLSRAYLEADTNWRSSMQRLHVQIMPVLVAEDLTRDVDRKELSGLLAERAIMLEALRRALADLHEISFISRNWRVAIRRAANEYLLVGASRRLESPVLTEYRRWLSCEGTVFRSQPYFQSENSCSDEAPYKTVMQKVLELDELVRTPGLGELNDFYAGVREGAIRNLQGTLNRSDRYLADFVADDGVLAGLEKWRMLAADRQALQDVLSAGKSSLLTLSNGADLVDADAGIREGRALRPESFHALQYANRFSRMALLSGRDLNRLSADMAGRRFLRWPLHPEGGVRYSFLYDALRSVAGNQQWQPFGLPYARAAGAAQPEDPAQRQYGYGPADRNEKGLAIFIDPEARRMVFRKLFPQPLSLVEAHPRMQAPNYPFPSCADNPFPVTFTSAGTAAEADNSCSSSEVVLP